MTRITTTHAVADRNRRGASELARISARYRKVSPWATARSMNATVRKESYSDRKLGARSKLRSSAGRPRRQQVTQSPHGLNDIDFQLLADAADKHFNGVGVAVEILVIQVFHQFGARDHAPGMVHEIFQQPVLVRGHL